MVDLGSTISSIIPSKSSIISGTSSAFVWITILILVVIALALGGIGIWFLARRLQYNKKIDIFEDRNGYMEWIGKDRAKELIYNSYGDSVFFLKKRKKYLPRGEIKIAKNKYIYAISQDGTWVNCGLESIDENLKELQLKPIHPDMRAFKSGMAKLIKERYEKKSFLKEWAPILVPIIGFIIIMIGMYFIIDRIVASENNLLKMTDASAQVMEKASQVLSALDNVCSNSGIKLWLWLVS